MAQPMQDFDWVPEDSFGARLALVRQAMGGWNVKRAAAHCGLDAESWRWWERGRSPQQMDRVARKVSEATGCSYTWLLTGGELAPQNWKYQNWKYQNWKYQNWKYQNWKYRDPHLVTIPGGGETGAPSRGHLHLVEEGAADDE